MLGYKPSVNKLFYMGVNELDEANIQPKRDLRRTRLMLYVLKCLVSPPDEI